MRFHLLMVRLVIWCSARLNSLAMRLQAWSQRKLDLAKLEMLEDEFPIGTLVILTDCTPKCRAEHEGPWIVERYGLDGDDYTITRPAFWIEKYGRDRDTILFAKHGTIKATPHKMEIPWPT